MESPLWQFDCINNWYKLLQIYKYIVPGDYLWYYNKNYIRPLMIQIW